MDDQTTLDEYACHSLITDPGEYGHLFDGLPRDLSQLVSVVQGLVLCMPRAKHHGVQLAPERREEIGLRSISRMLSRIVDLNPASLLESRAPDERLVGLCRDFGVLLVSMLRSQGVPARLRVGFGGYFPSTRLDFWDHRIAEYWDNSRDRWVLVDPMIDDVSRETEGIDIDILDLGEESPFYLAGQVWRDCRAGKADPDRFGDSPDDIGMAPIRYALLHDFDAVNKVELVGPDAWHPLIEKPESDLDEQDRAFLDRVAHLTTDPRTSFDDLRGAYTESEYGRAVERRLSAAIGDGGLGLVENDPALGSSG